MIEGISAVTLGTHEMPRAVRFYRALGFEILYGGEASSFTSFRAGTSYLNHAERTRRAKRYVDNPAPNKMVRDH